MVMRKVAKVRYGANLQRLSGIGKSRTEEAVLNIGNRFDWANKRQIDSVCVQRGNSCTTKVSNDEFCTTSN
jgi:hypothetical protein